MSTESISDPDSHLSSRSNSVESAGDSPAHITAPQGIFQDDTHLSLDPLALPSGNIQKDGLSSRRASRSGSLISINKAASGIVNYDDESSIDARSELHYNALKELRLFEKTDNIGSVTRDHLANERTFLAYIRTTLNFLLCSITLNQLYKAEQLELILAMIDSIQTSSTSTQNQINSQIDKISNNQLFVFIRVCQIGMICLGIFCCITGFMRYFINLNIMINLKKFSVSRIVVLVIMISLLTFNILILYQGIKGLVDL